MINTDRYIMVCYIIQKVLKGYINVILKYKVTKLYKLQSYI